MTATVSLSQTAATGSRNVTVTNPDGSSAVGALVLAIDAAPSPTAIAPSAITAGTDSQSVTITGTDFASGATVAISGPGITVNSVTVNSAMSLTARITASANARPARAT